MKTLALIHTVNWHTRLINLPLIDPWLAENPDIRAFNIADDSLLVESLAAGGATNAVIRRLQYYFLAAEAMGADVIVSTCTTVGEAARIARDYLSVPVFNIDEPMAREAVSLGTRIGIVATVPTSPPATQRQLARAAREVGASITTTVSVVPGAFDHLQQGRVDEHDRLVTAELDRMSESVDVLVLGQISLSQIRHHTEIPLLAVGASGLAEVRRLLDLAG